MLKANFFFITDNYFDLKDRMCGNLREDFLNCRRRLKGEVASETAGFKKWVACGKWTSFTETAVIPRLISLPQHLQGSRAANDIIELIPLSRVPLLDVNKMRLKYRHIWITIYSVILIAQK